jgi:hypothetical protein
VVGYQDPRPGNGSDIGFKGDTKRVYNQTTMEFDDKSTTSHYLFAGNQYLGEMKETGETNVKSAHFSGVDVKDSGSRKRHQVQEGDSLRSLSTLYYGNQDYWYVIADANGLPSDADALLTAGQSLEIPQQANSANSFDSFTAYSIMEQIGDTMPNLPYVPAPPQAGCNAIAAIIIIAIVVIVTIYTAGAASGAVGATTTSAAGTTTAAAGSAAGTSLGAAGAAGSVGSTFAAGSAALGGSLGATGALAAGIGGFTGALAGQLAGNILGVQDGFSLKNALASGLTAGATAGLGSVLSGGAGALTSGGKALLAGGSAIANAGANKLLGNPSGFRWANVAASAASAFIGSIENIDGAPLSQGFAKNANIVSDAFGGIARAGISYGVTKGIFNEGSWNFVDVAADAFGNALGNSVVRAQSGGSATGGGDKAAKGTQAGQQVYQEAINGGASPQQATVAAARAIAESTGGAVNVTDELAAQLTAKNSFAYNENDTFQLSNGSDTAIINFGRPEDVNYTLSGISQFLSGSPASDLSYNFAVNSIAGKFGRDASFAAGVARGEASYNYHARDRLAGIANDARNNRIAIASNRAIYERDKAFGTVGDFGIGIAQGFGDSIYQGVQFLGTAAASLTPLGQGISYLTGNGALNPFTTEYHSFLDAPTTVQQAGGRQLGEILSFAAGGEGILLAGAKGARSVFGASRVATTNRGMSDLVAARAELRSLDTSNFSTSEKGLLGETRASLTYQRAGYAELDARLPSNNGFDGVFVKYDSDGMNPLDIIINESKFTSTGNASLSNTNMGRQMSSSWIDANIQKMMNSSNPTIMENGFFLDSNSHLIRTKINVLNPQGVNGWNVLKAPK